MRDGLSQVPTSAIAPFHRRACASTSALHGIASVQTTSKGVKTSIMARKYFGTDGIRGETNKGAMTAAMAMRVAQAAGAHFRRGDIATGW